MVDAINENVNWSRGKCQNGGKLASRPRFADNHSSLTPTAKTSLRHHTERKQGIAVMSLSTGKPVRVGCVGGGQLGRMMALEAPRIGIQMSFLDPGGTSCPAAQVTPHTLITQGSLKDPAALHTLVKDCDVVTVEIEHVGVETLEQLEKEGVNVQPSARVLGIIQDKYIQKVRDKTILFIIVDYMSHLYNKYFYR